MIRTGLLALLLTASASTGPAADVVSLQVARAEVRIICPLTIGGSFDIKTTAVEGRLSLVGAHPPDYGGDVSVDLRALDTGIALRNSHLRDEYLETGRGEGFEKAVVSGIQLAPVDPDTFQGRTSFTGTLLLHGVKRPIAGQVQIRRSQSAVRAEASFPVIVSDYGIAKPQYLGVGVKNEIQVKVTLDLAPVAPSSSR